MKRRSLLINAPALVAIRRSEGAMENISSTENFTSDNIDSLKNDPRNFPLGSIILTHAEQYSYVVVDADSDLTTVKGIGLRAIGSVLSPGQFARLDDWMIAARDRDASGFVGDPIMLDAPAFLDLQGSNPDSEHIYIRGNGAHSKTFIVNNLMGGLIFQGSGVSRQHTVQLENMHFEPGMVGAGPGLRITGIAGGVSRHTAARLTDILYGPIDESSSADFSDGIEVSGVYRPEISRLRVMRSNEGTGKWKTAIKMDGCYAPFINDVWINVNDGMAAVGISHRGEKEEGSSYFNTTISGCDIGLWFERTGREPGFHWYGGHINCGQVGMRLDGIKYAVIDGILMYSSFAVDRYIDFEVTDADGVIFNNIQFRTPCESRRHFVLEPSATKANAMVRNIEINLTSASLFAETMIAPIYCNGATNVVIRIPSTVSTQDFVSYPNNLVELGPNQNPAEITIIRSNGWQYVDDGDMAGPVFNLDRASRNPSPGDALGVFQYRGRNSSGNALSYAAVRAEIMNASSGGEVGSLDVFTMAEGNDERQMNINQPATDKSTSLQLNVRIGGIKTLVPVTVGEPDSGGVGFRVLRIPN